MINILKKHSVFQVWLIAVKLIPFRLLFLRNSEVESYRNLKYIFISNLWKEQKSSSNCMTWKNSVKNEEKNRNSNRKTQKPQGRSP